MEHLREDEILSYQTRTLTPSGLLRVSDHLIECETCRVRVSAPSGVEAEVAAMHARLQSEAEAFAHLTYDEIAAYVDGASADARVDRHVRECAGCAAQVRDLRIVKAEIGLRERVAPARGWAWWKAAFALAAAAACLLAMGVVFYSRPKAPVPVAEAPRTPQPAPSPTSVVAGLDRLPPGVRNAVEHALSTGRLDLPPALAELAARRDVLMGASSAPPAVALLGPIGIVVEDRQPVFRWKAVAGAEYQVKVFTSDFQPSAESPWIRQTEWRTPVALLRGAKYSWQLTVRRDGSEITAPEPPEPEARFQVLDAASERELALVRSESQESHLVIGIAYARAGLVAEARRELAAAAAQDPGSAVVKALLAGLNSDQRQSK